MEPVRLEKVVGKHGKIVIEDLPFDEGQSVEVIISEGKNGHDFATDPYPLRGTPYRYDLPFEPIFPLEDWEES